MFSNKKQEFARKVVSYISAFLLLFQAFAPYYSLAGVITVNAQTVTPTESNTPVPTVTEVTEAPAPTEATPTITIEPTTEEEQTAVEESTNETTTDESQDTTVNEDENSNEVTPTVVEEEVVEAVEEGDIQAFVTESYQCYENSLNGCEPTVGTDKEDYAPTEVVFVYGTNFDPNTEYNLVITSEDEPAVKFEVTVLTDVVGSFDFSYQLDGTYRPNYLVEVFNLAGALVAHVTFTDSYPSGTQTLTPVIAGCVAEQFGGDVVCTANDISISNVTNINILDDGCQYPGDTVTFEATYNVVSTATQRYDVGLYFSSDGDPNSDGAETGSCNIGTLPYGPTPTWKNYDGNQCGDISSSAPLQPQLTMTAACLDTDGDNLLDLPYCTTWKQNAAGSCSDPTQAVPGTKSKCNCQDGFEVPIVVPAFAMIEVIKDLNPADDSGTFNLQVDESTRASCVGDQGTTGSISVDAGTNSNPGNSHTVGETACGGVNLNDYETSISCVYRGTNTVVSSSNNTGPLSVPVQPEDDIVCTITNTNPTGTLTVTKYVEPDTDTGRFNLLVDGNVKVSDVGDNGTTGLMTLDTGSHVVSESAGTNTDLSKYTSTFGGDCDSEGNVVITSGGNASCTITNTRKSGQIKIVKNTSGADGTFDFAIGGPSVGNPQISTTSNTGDTGFLTVDTGEYSVTETVPTSWKLENASCVDAQGAPLGSFAGNAVSGIQVNNGDQVTCTFENTRLRDITACKFEDVNGDGQRQEDEPLLSDWDITLTDENDDETPQTTGENGCTTFSDLEPGDYSLAETLKDNWTVKTLNPVDVVLSSSSNKTVYFGNFECSTISGMKWEDTNGNGVRDEGENPVQNWPINLSGESTDATTTDASGNYSFNVCVGGDHTVSEGTLDAELWYQTYPSNNGDYDFVVESGQTYEGNDFGNAQYASISGFKYRDNDGDGTLDADDLLDTLEGWVFDLYDALTNVIVDTFDATLTDGFYSFTGLLAGNSYYVLERQQDGWTQTVGPVSPSPSPITVESADDIEINFANFENVSVKVCKSEDAGGDADSINDREPVIGWTVNLLVDGEVDDTQVTGRDGCYTWSDLGPGHTYGVSEEVPANWVALGDTTHSFGPATSGSEYSHTFVNYELGSISGVKYNDINGNGQNDEEPLLSGWTIFIDENGNEELDNEEVNTVTDGSGAYSFTGLNPGTYSVCEVSQAGWTQTSSPTCHTVPLISGQDADGKDFGNQGQGSIKVIKNVDVDGVGGVDGEVSEFNELSWEWYLDADAGHASSATVPVVAGIYDITESGITDFSFTSLVCDTQNYETDGNSAEVTVNPGDNITCTYVNTRDTGTIVVNKEVDTNADGDYEGGNDVAAVLGFVWGLGDEDPARVMGSSQVVVTSTYDLTESDVDNYSFTGWYYTDGEGSCESPDGFGDPEVSVTKDQTVSVTFCNAHDTGTVIVDKVTDPTGSQQAFDFAFNQGESELETFQLTDADDAYVIENVLAGLSYNVVEGDLEGWDLSNVNCLRSDEASVDPTGFDFEGGETVYCTFYNTQRTNIEVTKYHDRNVNGIRDKGEEVLEGWDINLGEDTETTDENGEVLFANKVADDYILSETLQENWNLSAISCYDGEVSTNENGLELDLTPGDEINCEIGNYTTGDITVTKIRDNDGDLETTDDQTVLEGWEITLDYDETQDSDLTDENGEVLFADLLPGTYGVGEVQQDGYQLIKIVCDDESILDRLVRVTDEVQQEVNPQRFVSLQSGESISCRVYNQPTDPIITIEKLNNATGVLSAGNQVIYTLRLTVSEEGGPSLNTIVTDLAPEGFEYVSGSYSATKNGANFPVSEPTYASPGDWTLGDLEPGDVVEMFYTTNISNDQDSGLYPDVAWAIGESVGGDQILADAGTDGNISDPNFVGTDVKIAVNEQIRKGVNVKREKEEEGEVLGISLPATGAQTVWMILAMILAVLGLASVGTGYAMLRTKSTRRLPKIIKQIIKGMSVFAFAAIVATAVAGDAHASPIAGTSVRIETPADTSRDEFKVNFVVLDIENRTVDVKCFQKGPGDVSYSQFDSTKNLQAGGDNGFCQVDSSVIDQDGTYLFYVEATPAGDSAIDSAIVSADVNTDAPKTPTNYSKKKLNSCKYELRFRTGDDSGLTAKIEVYRSDLTSFNADNGSRVHQQSAGSNESIVYTDEVSDCNKSYYYAVRAFSSAGVGSGIVGDSVTVTVSSTGTTTTTTQGTAEGGSELGAIPVDGASTTGTGSDEDGTDGSDEESDETTTEEDAEVLGETTDQSFPQKAMSFFQNPVVIGAIIVLLILAILGYVIQKRRS